MSEQFRYKIFDNTLIDTPCRGIVHETVEEAQLGLDEVLNLLRNIHLQRHTVDAQYSGWIEKLSNGMWKIVGLDAVIKG